MNYKLICGNSLEELKKLEDNSIDSVVTDPPYEIGFMGKAWDKTGIAYNEDLWKECLRVLKPGGHLLSFSGSRTYHRMTCAIEDAGFEIRDQIQWLYGTGFPKSLNISKAIDKEAGHNRTSEYEPNFKNGTFGKGMGGGKHGAKSEPPVTESAKQWNGWGTALKPAHEPICFARKPLSEKTVAENVLKWGVGGINIDSCMVGEEVMKQQASGKTSRAFQSEETTTAGGLCNERIGRWPANIIHDGSEEVVSQFPYNCGNNGTNGGNYKNNQPINLGGGNVKPSPRDKGSAARFFYCAKASKKDRGVGNNHATVKPTDLMKYLIRLVTPKGGVVLDPFNGSGSTGKACAILDFDYIGIDLSQEYIDISKARIENELKIK